MTYLADQHKNRRTRRLAKQASYEANWFNQQAQQQAENSSWQQHSGGLSSVQVALCICVIDSV